MRLLLALSFLSAVFAQEFYIGQIQAFAFGFCPVGWAACNGATLSITQNTALFSLLGTTYGGNGQTNFGLPDLQGRTARGTGTGPGLTTVQLGQKAGSETTTLLTSNLPAHNHVATFSGTPATTTFTNNIQAVQAPGQPVPQAGGLFAQGANAGTGQANIYLPSGSSGNTVQLNGGQNSFTSTPAGTIAVSNTGNNQAFGTLDPYLGLTYCICTQGIFPSRP